MNNLQFIATYIYRNPGTRYREVMDAFHQWRGRDTGAHLSKSYRSWGCQYFSKKISPYISPGYNGHYWRRVDPIDASKGWVITFKGMNIVQEHVKPFVRYMPGALTIGGTQL